MFVHISPEADTLGESISTLKFAERVGSVELGAARVNKDNSEVKELKEQVRKPYTMTRLWLFYILICCFRSSP